MILTSDILLVNIRQKASLSPNQLNLTDQNILDMATLQLQQNVTALLMTQNQEYLIFKDTQPLTSNVSEYRFPTRTITQTLRHLYLVAGGTRYPLLKYFPEQIEQFRPNLTSPLPTGFYVIGNAIHFLPEIGTVPTGTSVEWYYPFRPSALTTTDKIRTITAVSGNSLTFSSLPTIFTSSAQYDVINNKSGNECILYDLNVSSIAGNTITFTTDVSKAAVGQYVSLAGTSPVPMVPEEFHYMLVLLTALNIQNMRQNMAAIQQLTTELKMFESAYEKMTNQRVDSKHDLIIPNNPLTPRNSRSSRRW